MPYARNGDVEIFYEIMGGAESGPTMLLINGLGSQCINYHEDWCALLVQNGLRVVRFDNRDVGLTTHFGDRAAGDDGAWYSVSDMAADAIAVLDATNASTAHIVGLSMGGMIAQVIAIEHPERVRTLTSVMSSTGERDHMPRSPEAVEQFGAPPPHDLDSFIEDWAGGLRVWGSPEFADEDRWRREATRAFERCFDPAGPGRQAMAMMTAPPRTEGLRALRVPTLVVHGAADTLIGSDAGRRTAALIPDARFVLVDGMGHDYPPQLWDRLARLFADHALGDGAG